MGGIGKTTLATNVYELNLVVNHFDFLAWVTISQKYSIRKILLIFLGGEGECLGEVDESELGVKLHKKLSGRRYLIIMDDVWNIEVWDRLKLFFPNNNNASRVMITTRLSNLARQINDYSHNFEIGLLDEDNSWKLFCMHVFGEEDCPILELREIGRNIVNGCKGLPLSISVVGGLLAKSKPTHQHWEEVEGNLNSIVNLDDNEHCLQILYMSYHNLPVHLKPCFLYIGILGVTEIVESNMIIVLIAEGFVKPIHGKSLEESAKEYITELIDRNLILIDKDHKKHMFERKCFLHDLFKDLCYRESAKQKFVCYLGKERVIIPDSFDSIRSIICSEERPLKEEFLPIFEQASSLVRSLWWRESSLSSISCPLLRMAPCSKMDNLEDVAHLVNLRIIFLQVADQCRMPHSISRFWNLQTLVIDCEESSDILIAPSDIWIMPQLINLFAKGRLCLPDPPTGSVVLGNLHTLSKVYNLKCSEEMVKRIPNIKSLDLRYRVGERSSLADYCLNNLGGLQQLEALIVEVYVQRQMVHNHTITFPRSLKFLSLLGTTIKWDDVTTKIGSLPLLEHLELDLDSGIAVKWETAEGQFCNLKFLLIIRCWDLEHWITETTHFPRLQLLVLCYLHKLNEIPSSIGDIPSLQMIEVKDCSDSVNYSAQRIQKEQEELGNEDLKVNVIRCFKRLEKEINRMMHWKQTSVRTNTT